MTGWSLLLVALSLAASQNDHSESDQAILDRAESAFQQGIELRGTPDAIKHFQGAAKD